jgi:hypothetical protein
MANIQVTGTLNPNCAGTYVEDGTLNGRPRYWYDDGLLGYIIIWDGVGNWKIADVVTSMRTWTGPSTVSPEGTYNPDAGQTGTATATFLPETGGGGIFMDIFEEMWEN